MYLSSIFKGTKGYYIYPCSLTSYIQSTWYFLDYSDYIKGYKLPYQVYDYEPLLLLNYKDYTDTYMT